MKQTLIEREIEQELEAIRQLEDDEMKSTAQLEDQNFSAYVKLVIFLYFLATCYGLLILYIPFFSLL